MLFCFSSKAFDVDRSGSLELNEFTALMRKFCKTDIPLENVTKTFEMCGGPGNR